MRRWWRLSRDRIPTAEKRLDWFETFPARVCHGPRGDEGMKGEWPKADPVYPSPWSRPPMEPSTEVGPATDEEIAWIKKEVEPGVKMDSWTTSREFRDYIRALLARLEKGRCGEV